MNGVEINTRAYVATRLLLRWDYLYAVTVKTKVFGDYNHARLEVSWITSTRGLLLRGYTGLEHGRCKQSIFSLSIFGIWSNGLASSVFIFAAILLRLFLLSSSMQGLKFFVTDFLISTYEKSYASSKPIR